MAPAVAHGECRKPELQSLLESVTKKGYFPSLDGIYAPHGTDKNEIQWLGTSWWGPRGGILFALDCSGHPIDNLELGAVTKLSRFEGRNVKEPSVIAEFVAGTGTGYELRRIGIYRLYNQKIAELWSHDLYVYAFILPNEEGTETEYQITISADGAAISVVGFLKTYPVGVVDADSSAVKVEKLPIENFCWDGVKDYKACSR